MEIFLDSQKMDNRGFVYSVKERFAKNKPLGKIILPNKDLDNNYNACETETPIVFDIISGGISSQMAKNIACVLYQKFKRPISIKRLHGTFECDRMFLISGKGVKDIDFVFKPEAIFNKKNVYMGKTQLQITEKGLPYIKYRFCKMITPEKLFEIVRELFDEFPAVNVSQMKKFSKSVMFYKNMPDETLKMALSDLLRVESLIAAPKPEQPREPKIHITTLPVATHVKPEIHINTLPVATQVKPEIHITTTSPVPIHVKPKRNTPQETPTVVMESAPEPDIITEKPDGLDPAVLNKTTHMTLKPNADIEKAKQNAQKMADNGYCCVKILDNNGIYICTVYPHSSTYHLKKMRDLAHQILNYTQPTQER